MNSTKPPYFVPTMAEVAAVPPNGLTVVSTFSGCGGSCLGFRMAGYRVLWASEFVPAARETYGANYPDTPLDSRDIRQVEPADVLAAIGREAGDVDVMEGSPPCASFSTAGKRDAHWGQIRKYSDTKQRTDDLFFEFARLVAGIKPRVFVAENVSGLAIGRAVGYFKEIHAALTAAGYNVEARMLDAQWLGVPQSRRRVIFVGVRSDLEALPAFPSPLPYRYSMADAIPGLCAFESFPYEGGENWKCEGIDRPAPTVSTTSDNTSYVRHRVIRDESIDGTAIGREWAKLREGQQSDRYFSLIRPDRVNPMPTATATGGIRGAAGVTHPAEPRKFTIHELKALCSFPPDFQLTGTYAQQWERLGRAVPPLMMKAIASAIAEGVFNVRNCRDVPNKRKCRASAQSNRASRT